MAVRIDTFRREHAPAFDALNRAWLVGHDLIEAHDVAQLTDPWSQILDPGGQIFVAIDGDDVVGVCAAIPHGGDAVEVAKLAVDPTAQGRGIGRRLVDACLAFARARGCRRVELVSSSRLQAALKLYQSMGFRQGPLPADVPYATADIYMEFDLTIDTTSTMPFR
jgi:ribosomal protein S18 acetylase RimI-like enzyme